MSYTVLNPHANIIDEIQKREQVKHFFLKNVMNDFDICLVDLQLSDVPFAAVINGMYLAGFAPQSIMLTMQHCVMRALCLLSAANADSGDALSKNGNRIEMKGSACFKFETVFKLKQIRPHHDVTHYLFYLFDGLSNTLTWLWIPALSLYALAEKFEYFNHSVHGTAIANQFNQTFERELTLHPKAQPTTKAGRCWNELQLYKVSLVELYAILNDTFSDPIITRAPILSVWDQAAFEF